MVLESISSFDSIRTLLPVQRRPADPVQHEADQLTDLLLIVPVLLRHQQQAGQQIADH
ncbi:hypothetical protein D3C80_2055260 [compost metagenome]